MIQNAETIAAISTPPGPGGIGMVRITGPEAGSLAVRIFTPHHGWKSDAIPERRALYGLIHPPDNGNNPIDQGVLVFYRGPRSSTGEDTAELTAHGGVLVMRAVLAAALEAGARLAEPGEFTRRAFLNGRMDLAQAEAVASLIFAATERARRILYRQVEGALAREVEAVRDLLVEAKALVEASIDFPDQIAVSDGVRLREGLESARAKAGGLLLTSRRGVAMAQGLRAVVVGTPNVGKSSLFNALIGEERAIVHETAGTTRDYLEGRIDVLGIPLEVVDTAGVREGAGPVEVQGIFKTRRLMERADLVIVVIDLSRPPSGGDLALLAETSGAGRVVAANKNDLPRAQWPSLPEGAIRLSAITGEGMDDLRQAIWRAAFGSAEGLDEDAAAVTSVRQAEALSGGLRAIERALQGGADGVGPECVAVDLDEALARIGELTGEVSTEEILDRVFSRFCIGK